MLSKIQGKNVSTYGIGINSNAHFGKNGMAKNLRLARNVGVNRSFPAFKNSFCPPFSKQPGSMLNPDLTTFSVVKRIDSLKCIGQFDYDCIYYKKIKSSTSFA